MSERIAQPTDTKILDKVATCLKVPEEKRPNFQRCLTVALNEARRGHGMKKGLPRQSPVAKALERIRGATPKRALALVRKNRPEDEAAATFLSIAIVPNEIEEWIVAASPEERCAEVDKAQAYAQALRESGATPGTRGNAAFDLFVSLLYNFAAELGGQPGNASRKGSEKVVGNIPKALEILRLELPPGFIPGESSILSAVQRAKKERENG